MSGAVWAIVVAGGAGQRFGAEKQFLEVLGRPVFAWSVEAAATVADGIVLVVPPDRRSSVGQPEPPPGVASVVVGGKTRAASVRAGLEAVPPDTRVIVVHDAVRPLASRDLFRAVVRAVEDGADGAIPGLAIVDTVKRVRSGAVVETLDRSELVRVQTPQAFRSSRLRAAHASGGDATDDAHLVEALGGTVVVVEGEATNVKVTTPSDLALVERLLSERAVTVPQAGQS